jgi:hypothetical protein
MELAVRGFANSRLVAGQTGRCGNGAVKLFNPRHLLTPKRASKLLPGCIGGRHPTRVLLSFQNSPNPPYPAGPDLIHMRPARYWLPQ